MSQGEDREGHGIEQSLSDAAAPNGNGTGSQRVQQDQGPNEGRPTFGSDVHLFSGSPLRQLGRSVDELTRAVSHTESLLPWRYNVERAHRTLSGDRGEGVVSDEGQSVRVASARGAARMAGGSIEPQMWDDPYPSEDRFNPWLPLDGEGPFLRPPLAVPLSLLRERQRSDDRANATGDLVQQALEEATRAARIPVLGHVGGSVPLGGVSDAAREVRVRVRRVMMEAVMENFRATREMQRRAEESVNLAEEVRRRFSDRHARQRMEQSTARRLPIEEQMRRIQQMIQPPQQSQQQQPSPQPQPQSSQQQQQQQPPSPQPLPEGSQSQPQQQQEVPPGSLSQQPWQRPRRSPLVLRRLDELTDDLTNLDRRLRSLSLVSETRPSRLDNPLNSDGPRASVANAAFTADENIHAGDANAAATGAAPLPPLSEDDISAMPPSFLCPISLAPMSDPILCMDGHSFDRASILQHVRSRRDGGLPLTSPLTNQAMGRDMWMNHTLKKAIHEWVEARRSQQERGDDEDVHTLQAEHESLLERFQQLEDDYDALHAEHESHEQTSQQQQHQLNHRFQTLRAQHNQLKQDHEDLRKQVVKQRDQHKTQFTQLQTRHTALQQRHEKMSRRHKVEEDRLRLDLAVDRRMWTEREERMKGEYADLYAEFEALQAQTVDDDEQRKEGEQHQEALTRSPSSLQQPQHSDAEYEKLFRDHQSLVAEHQTLQERYKSLEGAHVHVTASGEREQLLPSKGPGTTDDGSDEGVGGAGGVGSGGGDGGCCGKGDYQRGNMQTPSEVQSQQDPIEAQQQQQQQAPAQQEEKEDADHDRRHTPPHHLSLDEQMRQAFEPLSQPQPRKRLARQQRRRPPTPKRPAKTTPGNKIINRNSNSAPSSPPPPPPPHIPPPPASSPSPSTQTPAVTPATVALAAAPLIGGLFLTRYLG